MPSSTKSPRSSPSSAALARTRLFQGLRLHRYLPYFPTPKQAAFLLLPHREALFGGAAGGGKSIALLMAALQYIDVPGYAALLLRRHYTDLALPGALMDVAHAWLDTSDAHWNGADHTWTFPTSGRPSTLSFGYLANVNDQYRYQSAQLQYIGFDELTQFREVQYRYLFSRLRRPAGMPVPLRMRGACIDRGEVLTEQGWQSIVSIKPGQQVYSVDEAGMMDLKPVLALHRYAYNGPLVRVRKKNLYMSMTPEHRVVFRPYGRPGNRHRYRLTPFVDHQGRSITILRAACHYSGPGWTAPPLDISVEDYLAFLGLFLAEGCTNALPKRSNYRIIVTQCSAEKSAKVRALLARLPLPFCSCANGDFQATNKVWWLHFRQFGKAHEKFIPRDILRDATAAQLHLLFSWLVFGDGSVRNGGSNITYSTTSRQLRDDVAEIAVKLGYKVCDGIDPRQHAKHRIRYWLYLTAHAVPETKVDKNDVRNDVVYEHFRGEVFCLTVAETQTFVVRQRGTIWISGNSNPGGAGHAWVKQRFLTEGVREGRPFLPSRLDDNPHLDRTAYMATMAYLDPLTRQQLLDGNWDAEVEGELFRREWFPIVEHGPREGRVVRYWDLAATAPRPGATDPDWTVGGKVRLHRGQYWIMDVRRIRTTPKGVDDLVAQTAHEDGKDVEIHIEQEGGASGKLVIDRFQRDVLPGYTVSGHPPSGDKVTRARPASSAAEAGNVLLVHGPWITPFLDELGLFPSGDHDDQVDVLSGAVAVLTQEPRRIRAW